MPLIGNRRRIHGTIVIFLTLWLVVLQARAGDQSATSGKRGLAEDVSTEDVKRFLDPVKLTNSLDYVFNLNSLPQEITVFSHTISPTWAINHKTAFWAGIPLLHSSGPSSELPSGIGDISLGWGVATHENLNSRFTASAVWFEASAPTGSFEKESGVGAWVLSPGGWIALNPTDRFPVYIVGTYRHSVGKLGGAAGQSEPAGESDVRVRSLQLDIQTSHIFPKGFFVTAAPSFTRNFGQDFNSFTLGVDVGRALNKQFAILAGYVHHVAGTKTLNQAFFVGLNFLIGEVKTKDPVLKGSDAKPVRNTTEPPR